MAEVEKLEQAAGEVLASLWDDESLKWVRESALAERAFLIGANKFAEAVFPGQESKRLGVAIMRTILTRQHDDPFLASEVGQLYSDLRRQWEWYCGAVIEGKKVDFPEDLLKKSSDLIDGISKQNSAALDHCRRCVGQIWQGLAAFKNAPETNREAIARMYDIFGSLEEPLRFLTGGKAS